MTTVAYRDGIMAADGREVVSKIVVNDNAKKLARLKGGAICGYAGTSYQFPDFVKQYDFAMKENPGELPVISGCRGLIVLVADGDHLYCWEKGWEQPMSRSFFAIGSGMFLAIAAMEAGATAQEAVVIASKMSPYSGGQIRTMRV